MKEIEKKNDDRAAWMKWLKSYGGERFYDSFVENAQDARGTCRNCKEAIYLDIVEGGGVPDWRTDDGDYGCFRSPDTCEEGTGSHVPIKLRARG